MSIHPSGQPYCDGEFCDEAGVFLQLQSPPLESKHYCMGCLQKYVYNRDKLKIQHQPNDTELPNNVKPFKK